MPRVKTKDFTSRLGKYIPNPPAVSMPPGGMPTPLSTGGSRALQELSLALKGAGAKLHKGALVSSEEEQKEGAIEGRSMALKAYRTSLGEMLNQANKLTSDGQLKHGENPFTVQNMHINTGVLLARAPASDARIRDGMNAWISEYVQTKETNVEDFNKTFMAEIVQPELDYLIQELPDTRSARDIGFAQAIVPVVQKIKGDANALYNKFIIDKNFDNASEVVNGLLREGKHEKAFEEVRGRQGDPEDEGEPGLPHWGLQLGPYVDTRIFMFDRVKSYIDNDIVTSPMMGTAYTQSLIKGLGTLSDIMNMREPVSNALVSDPAAVKDKYGKYKLELERRLLQAQRDQAGQDSANDKIKTDFWERHYQTVAPQMQAIMEQYGEMPDGSIVDVSRDMGVITYSKKGEPTKIWENSARFVELEEKFRKAGLLKRPDNGEVWRFATDGTRYSTPKQVLADEDSEEQIEGIMSVIDDINVMIKNGRANTAHEREVWKQKLSVEEAQIFDRFNTTIRAMQNIDGDDFAGARKNILPELMKLYAKSAFPDDVIGKRAEYLEQIKTAYSHKFRNEAVSTEVAIFNFLGKNIQKYADMSEWEQHATLLTDLKGEGLTANEGAVTKALRILNDEGTTFWDSYTIKGSQAQSNIDAFKDLLYKRDPVLYKYVEDQPAELGLGGRRINLAVGKNRRERKLLTHIEDFFREQYKPLVKTIFEANKYHGKKSLAQLGDILAEKGSEPVRDTSTKGADGKEIPGKILLPSSLLHQFLEIPHGVTIKGEPFPDWRSYMDAMMRGEQIDDPED